MRVCKRVLTFGLALTMLLLLAIPGFAVPSSEGNAGGSVETGIDTDNSYNLDNDVYFIETDTMLYDENNATHYNPFDLPDTLGEDFKIHYYDSETNEDLEGAEFTIVNSDKEVVARSVYYGNGLYGFENLLELYPSFIEWYLVQTKAPEGYVSMQSIMQR